MGKVMRGRIMRVRGGEEMYDWRKGRMGEGKRGEERVDGGRRGKGGKGGWIEKRKTENREEEE